MKIKRFLNIGLAGLFLANVAYAQSYQFDFSEKKKVEKGVIQISSDSIYPCKGGYGYDFLPAPVKKSNEPFFFSVDVPDGNYLVTVTLGNARKAGSTTVRAESRRLFLENISTRKGEFLTYETRITRIDGIHVKNIHCQSADAIYELKGDARLPIRNVFVENVKVDTVRQFINRLSNVENFQANEVSATILLHKEAPSIDLDKLYKQKAE